MTHRIGWYNSLPVLWNDSSPGLQDPANYLATVTGSFDDNAGTSAWWFGVNTDADDPGDFEYVWDVLWIPDGADPQPDIVFPGGSRTAFGKIQTIAGSPPLTPVFGTLVLTCRENGVPLQGRLTITWSNGESAFGDVAWGADTAEPRVIGFVGDPLTGPAPLEVFFTAEGPPPDGTLPVADSYYIDCGDTQGGPFGGSGDINGYANPGLYDVSVRALWEDFPAQPADGLVTGRWLLFDTFEQSGADSPNPGKSPTIDFLIPSVWRDTGSGNNVVRQGGTDAFSGNVQNNASGSASNSIGLDSSDTPVEPEPYYTESERFSLIMRVDTGGESVPNIAQTIGEWSIQHDTFSGVDRMSCTMTLESDGDGGLVLSVSTNKGGSDSVSFIIPLFGTCVLQLDFDRFIQQATFINSNGTHHNVVINDDFSDYSKRVDLNLVTFQIRAGAIESMAQFGVWAHDMFLLKPEYVLVTGDVPPSPPLIGTAMNVLPVSRLIHVGVNLTPAGAQGQDLSTLLIMGTSSVIDTTERMRIYTRLEDVAADFGTSAEEYKCAVLWFEQVPQPSRLNIGRWVNASSKGGIKGATLPAASQLISAWTGIANGSFTVTKDGGAPQNVTGLNFTGAANLNAVAAIIQAGFAGTTVIWNATYQRFEITSNTTGATSAISFLSVQGAGTDVSNLLGMRSTSSGAYLFTGQVAESALEAVQAMNLAFNQLWYAVVVPSAVDADHLAIAPFLEGTNTKHFYGVTTQEAGVLVAADISNIAYQLKQLAYKKTMVQYSSSNPYAVVSALARILTTNYQGNSTVITLMYKQEPGIVAESINSLQADALESFNCNVFVNYDNNTAIFERGVTSSGIFADIVLGTDWLAVDLIKNLYNLLYTSTTKIPQTDAGTHLLVTTCEAVLTQAVINGLLAPGVWNSGGFGQLQQGDYLDKGFYVYAPSVNVQDPADRAARKSVPIQVAAKLAGAVHEVFVSVLVNQ